jgi:hypothetical protein
MFNRTNYVTVKDGPTYVTKTTTEYRAPTDESVRLLKEMEEKVHEKIINSISVRDCQVECQVIIEKDYMNRSNHYIVVYSMNGKKSKVKMMIDEQSLMVDPTTIVAERLSEMLAKDIAVTMLGDAFAKALANQPKNRCTNKNPDDMCKDCDCWKHTRAMCG